MKGFGILVFAAVMAFLGYQVAYPKIFDTSFFPTDHAPVQEIGAKQVQIPEVVALKPAPPQTPAQQPPPPAPKPAPPSVSPSPSPTVATSMDMAGSVKRPENPNEFHPPVFAPLGDLVKNWTAIPGKAFPHAVKLRRAVEFVMPIGKSKVGPGGIVTALEQQGANLIVAPTEHSPARGQVALNDTDLKESLTQAYEAWKVQTVAFKRQQWENRRNSPRVPNDTKPSTIAASNDKPVRSGDGTYPILLESMKRGQVTDITPASIKKWGDATQEKIDGKNYWVVVVDVTIITMFGPFDTTAEAHILNGRVEKWIFTKTRETVP